MFPEMKSRETLRFEGNKIHCSPRDQNYVLNMALLLIKQNKTKENFEKCVTFQRQHQATSDHMQLFNCFLFDVIVFEMLLAGWKQSHC